MTTIPHVVCGVIPRHILERVARQTTGAASDKFRATLEHMRELANGSTHTLLPSYEEPPPPAERCRVYDAQGSTVLPGRLVLPGRNATQADAQAREVWAGCIATLNFLEHVLGRRSIDDCGLCLVATVHYGTCHGNAMWIGSQLVYGDGDGRLILRLTNSVDVTAHEVAHGVIQYTAGLHYSGQTGALNEHLADVIGIMVKQYVLGQTAHASDWLIGAELFGPEARGCAVRSFAHPGTAYDHPILGRDPQPFHMDDYVHTDEDNGGVHINSGILNYAYYLAAIDIGGYVWKVLGKIWYLTLTDYLLPDASFEDFAEATIHVAGELFGRGSRIQRAVITAWDKVGLHQPVPFGARPRAGGMPPVQHSSINNDSAIYER